MEPVRSSRYSFGGVIGARLHANECNWLLRAPGANPGLLGMFSCRDLDPPRDIVPWAGEFAGKYLISAIQALRLSDSPPLRSLIEQIISDLLACQADEGYLGPFRKEVQLTANWDLWGHYHTLQALLLWHDECGDAEALRAAERIGDLICDTFLGTGVRVRDTGASEMNMAVIHGLGLLYLRKHNPRYLAMMREIEADWESAGNYLRAGIEGIPFYATRHPRWESLHDIQGLAAFYRITGDARYMQALESHWRSIMRWDVHNTGAFSTGEGAIGDAFTPGVVETCCTVAWMALTQDYLQLTGDPRAADALELALYNAIAGAQHADGAWWTYDTPMEGTRVPSYAALSFQARPDTPGLNCCSLNGPRGLTMLCDWAVMCAGKGLAVNYYGPGKFEGSTSDGTAVRLTFETRYPLDGRIRITVDPERPATFPLLLRVPAWSTVACMRMDEPSDAACVRLKPGRYATLDREWMPGDTVVLELDMRLRAVAGDGCAGGKASIYYGPILLAYDSSQNAGTTDTLPTMGPKALSSARITTASSLDAESGLPWITAAIPTPGGCDTILCDFAAAGRDAAHYHTWLPISGGPLPAPALRSPDDGAMLRQDEIVLTWSAPPPDVHELSYHVVVSPNADLSMPIINHHFINGTSYRITGLELKKLKTSGFYYWQVSIEGRRGGHGTFPARFKNIG